MIQGNIQVMETQPQEFRDFSGGMTDYYLGAALNKFEKGENLLIERYGNEGKLRTRPGSEIYDEDYSQIPAGAQRIGTLKYFEEQLFVHSARKLYYVDSGWNTLQGPSSNDLFPSGVDTTTVVSHTEWNGHWFVTNSDRSRAQKIYKDSGGTFQLRTAGLPQLASDPTLTPTAGANSYIYAFVHEYDYTVGTLSFKDRGPTRQVSVGSAADPGSGTLAITNIPVLANGSTHNYDTSNINIEIYRTTNGGTEFYYVGEVTNGTTTYNDTTSDANLTSNEPLYTTGGVVENDEPPLSKLVHITEDIGWWADVKLGTEERTNRCYQSIPGDPDSVPATFFVDVDDDIIGLKSVRGTPVLACTTSAYRVDGRFDLQGRGSLLAQKISDTCSCVSSQSMVQTLEGVFWAGQDGFYFSDGYQVQKISHDIDITYQSIVSSAERKRRIVGKYDPNKRRIYWTAQFEGSATEVDFCFVADLNYGIKKDTPFTTWTGDTFRPTAIEFIGTQLVRGDSEGYTLIHSDDIYVDPKIDSSASVADWGTSTIVYDFKSVATNFGTNFARKYVPRINLEAENVTNVSIQINSITDDGLRTASLRPIRTRTNITWGDPDVYWGDPNLIWNYSGLVNEWRRMPSMHLRCSYKQIELTPALVAIISSDIIGTATVNSSATTCTLDDTVTYDWPSGSVDYYLAFENDNYTNEFLVTARTDDVLTFSDPFSQAPDGSFQWVLRGKPKGDVLYLQSFTLHYAVFGKTQQAFRSSGTGEVGA